MSVFRSVAVAAFAGLLAAATPAAAGTVIVTGDSTIGSRQASGIAGNVQFARNILGSGKSVAIAADVVTFQMPVPLQASFNGFGNGVTATRFFQTVTADRLAGVDLFIWLGPSRVVTTAEIQLLRDFVRGGGTFLLGGEGATIGTQANQQANRILEGIGSSIRLDNVSLDFFDQFAEGNEIEADPLTAGVTRFGYGLTTTVTGGTTLFRTNDGLSFVASQSLVPEPASWALMILGFGVVGAAARRRRQAIA